MGHTQKFLQADTCPGAAKEPDASNLPSCAHNKRQLTCTSNVTERTEEQDTLTRRLAAFAKGTLKHPITAIDARATNNAEPVSHTRSLPSLERRVGVPSPLRTNRPSITGHQSSHRCVVLVMQPKQDCYSFRGRSCRSPWYLCFPVVMSEENNHLLTSSKSKSSGSHLRMLFVKGKASRRPNENSTRQKPYDTFS